MSKWGCVAGISPGDKIRTPNFAPYFLAKVRAVGVGVGSVWPAKGLNEADMSREHPQCDRKQ